MHKIFSISSSNLLPPVQPMPVSISEITWQSNFRSAMFVRSRSMAREFYVIIKELCGMFMRTSFMGSRKSSIEKRMGIWMKGG